jgi:threonine dehydratase
LAAAIKERSVLRGNKIGLVLSGANVDHVVFAQILGTSA